MILSRRNKLRLLGILPLTFFIAQFFYYWQAKQLGQMFWMCNIGNLILAMGLFLEKPALIRLTAIWTLPGLAVWFIWVVLTWGVFLSSILAHVGGIIVAMIAIRHYRMDLTAWRWALGWYLVVQLASRFFTPAPLNVNLAHAVQGGWEQTFQSYWTFWLVLTVGTIVILWLCGLLLWRIWPDSRNVL